MPIVKPVILGGDRAAPRAPSRITREGNPAASSHLRPDVTHRVAYALRSLAGCPDAGHPLVAPAVDRAMTRRDGTVIHLPRHREGVNRAGFTAPDGIPWTAGRGQPLFDAVWSPVLRADDARAMFGHDAAAHATLLTLADRKGCEPGEIPAAQRPAAQYPADLARRVRDAMTHGCAFSLKEVQSNKGGGTRIIRADADSPALAAWESMLAGGVPLWTLVVHATGDRLADLMVRRVDLTAAVRTCPDAYVVGLSKGQGKHDTRYHERRVHLGRLPDRVWLDRQPVRLIDLASSGKLLPV